MRQQIEKKSYSMEKLVQQGASLERIELLIKKELRNKRGVSMDFCNALCMAVKLNDHMVINSMAFNGFPKEFIVAMCASEGSINLLEYYYERWIKSKIDYNLALWHAAAKNKLKAFRWLVKHGADDFLRASDLASRWDSINIINYLAQTNRGNQHGKKESKDYDKDYEKAWSLYRY